MRTLIFSFSIFIFISNFTYTMHDTDALCTIRGNYIPLKGAPVISIVLNTDEEYEVYKNQVLYCKQCKEPFKNQEIITKKNSNKEIYAASEELQDFLCSLAKTGEGFNFKYQLDCHNRMTAIAGNYTIRKVSSIFGGVCHTFKRESKSFKQQDFVTLNKIISKLMPQK